MIKINKHILIGMMGMILLMALSLKGEADDSSSGMIVEQTELKGMIADNTVTQSPAHKNWAARNPFNTSMLQKDITPVVQGSRGLVLQGIFLGSDRPSAIINRTVVGVGKSIEGDTLKQIKGDTVILVDGGGNEIILSLKH